MPATFPGGVRTFRTKENRPGFEYDVDRKYNIFVEDLIALEEEIQAIETYLLAGGGPTYTGTPIGLTLVFTKLVAI